MTRRPTPIGAFSLVLAIGCGDAGDTPSDGSSDASSADTGNPSSTTPSSTSADSDGSDADTMTSDDADTGDDATDDSTPTDTGDDTGDPPGACGSVPTIEDGRTPTAEIHVATRGSDGDGCGAAASPCATLEAAAAQASPGTAIRIHAGTYPGGTSISGLAGTADAPIWIGGAPGEDRPVFEGGDVAMQLSPVRYLVLHDIEVRGMSANGINIDDGGAVDDPEATRGLVMRGLFIHDIGSGNNDCLKLSGVNDFAVLDSEFTVCGGGTAGSGIDMVGCHQGVVAFSNFHDMPESGNSVQTKGGSEDVEVYANYFENAGQRAVNMGGSTGFEFFRPPLDPAATNAEARDIRVVSNLFVGSFSQVGWSAAPAASSPTTRWSTRSTGCCASCRRPSRPANTPSRRAARTGSRTTWWCSRAPRSVWW